MTLLCCRFWTKGSSERAVGEIKGFVRNGSSGLIWKLGPGG